MKPNPNVLAFLKSLFFTYILTGILLFVLAFLFYKMKMPQSQLLLSFIIQKEIVQGIASSILIMAICAVCGMVGGMIS